MRTIIALLALSLPFTGIANSEFSGYKIGGKTITLGNWQTHPELVKASNIYMSVEEKRKKRLIAIKKREIDLENVKCIRPGKPVGEEIGLDASGEARLYRYTSLMSHGSVVRTSDYFDESGVRRFVLIQYAITPSSPFDEDAGKVFFDSKGRILFYINIDEGTPYIREIGPDSFLVGGPSSSLSARKRFDKNLGDKDCPELIGGR